MNHDVSTELLPALLLSACPIELIGIVQAQREMETAIGIERLDSVDAFGNLPISLCELGCAFRSS